VCHRESDQYYQCCPPDLHGCGAAFFAPYKNPDAVVPVVELAATSPTMPEAYSVTLAWTQQTDSGAQHFKVIRWYDLNAQKYRADTYSSVTGKRMEEVLELPATMHKRFSHDLQIGGCREQPDQSRIDGFIPVLSGSDVKVEDDTVAGTKAKKYTKKFAGYTVSVWFASGDSKVADGAPLQLYNSYNEEQKVQVGGIIRISNYDTKFDSDTIFALPEPCTHPATPAPAEPTPPPTPSNKHWSRDWSRTTGCGCVHTEWTGVYTSEAACMDTECKPPKVADIVITNNNENSNGVTSSVDPSSCLHDKNPECQRFDNKTPQSFVDVVSIPCGAGLTDPDFKANVGSQVTLKVTVPPHDCREVSLVCTEKGSQWQISKCPTVAESTQQHRSIRGRVEQQ